MEMHHKSSLSYVALLALILLFRNIDFSSQYARANKMEVIWTVGVSRLKTEGLIETLLS